MLTLFTAKHHMNVHTKEQKEFLIKFLFAFVACIFFFFWQFTEVYFIVFLLLFAFDLYFIVACVFVCVHAQRFMVT